MNIRIVRLNNKTRKGTYIYIKEKGQPSRYYKYQGKEGETEAYKEYYQDSTIRKKTKGDIQQYIKEYKDVNTKKQPTSTEKYIKEIKKQGSLNKNLGKGITNTNIPNILKATTTTIKKAKQELIQDLVINKNLLEQIIKEENMKKLKHRIEHRINIRNYDGETILEAKKFNITLNQLQRQLKNTIQEGETIQEDEKYGGAIQKLKNAGFQVSDEVKTGKINTISVHTIFRKAK